MIIAVDFDDTLFKYNPAPAGITDYSGRLDSIGEPRWEWINKAKDRRAAGDKLILWTCREGKALEHAVTACAEVGLFFDALNSNIRGDLEHLYWPDCRKVKADEYWDDKSVEVAP